jgi:flavin reductase ActVB
MSWLDGELFKQGMAKIAAPVTVVTTFDADGQPRGFTASAVCSLSVKPPLVLVCVAKSNASHNAFITARRFMVNLLAADQQEVALRFATPHINRFAQTGKLPTEAGLPSLSGCPVRLACQVYSLYAGGDHHILVGLVEDITITDSDPLLYYHRAFTRLENAELVIS